MVCNVGGVQGKTRPLTIHLLMIMFLMCCLCFRLFITRFLFLKLSLTVQGEIGLLPWAELEGLTAIRGGGG